VNNVSIAVRFDGEPAVGDVTPCIEDERAGRRPVANLNSPSAESVPSSVWGLARTTTVLSGAIGAR